MTHTNYSQNEESLQKEEPQNETNNEQPITNEAGESDPEALAEATLDAELTAEEALKLELDKAVEGLADMKDKYLRLSAEFDNFRKRTMKEKAELILNGSENGTVKITINNKQIGFAANLLCMGCILCKCVHIQQVCAMNSCPIDCIRHVSASYLDSDLICQMVGVNISDNQFNAPIPKALALFLLWLAMYLSLCASPD